MLDNFFDDQKVAYNIMLNSVKNDKISHAYLIESSDIKYGLEFAIAISKFLLCPIHYTNSSKCDKCIICEQINNGEFIELEFVKPDGKNIKKEQIIKLQENFRYKPVIGNRKIYIIEKAELLNAEAANSLLKFLEEPSEFITAILVTSNIYQVYETIKSRCQILKLKEKKQKLELSSVEKIGNILFENVEEKNIFLENNPADLINSIIEYVLYLDENKNNTIVFKNKNILNMLNDNFNIGLLFKTIILLYKEVLNYKLGAELEYFNDYVDKFDSIISNNTNEKLALKIEKIIDISNKIKFNVNSNLILDKMVMAISEV